MNCKIINGFKYCETTQNCFLTDGINYYKDNTSVVSILLSVIVAIACVFITRGIMEQIKRG